jgi:hypothetical protein
MDLSSYTALVIPSIFVVAGWIVTHQLSAWRDLVNRRRDQRIRYLIENFRVLVKAMNRRDSLSEMAEELETALADMQFLGNKEQIDAAYAISGALGDASQRVNFAPLIYALRRELRKDLGRKPLEEPMAFPVIRDRDA